MPDETIDGGPQVRSGRTLDHATAVKLAEVKTRRWTGEQFEEVIIGRLGLSRASYVRARGVNTQTFKRWRSGKQEVSAREQEWAERALAFIENAAFYAISTKPSDMTPFRFREVVSLLRWGGIRGIRYPVLEDVTQIPEHIALAMAHGWQPVPVPLADGLEAIADGLRSPGEKYVTLGRLGWSAWGFASLRRLQVRDVRDWIGDKADLAPDDQRWLDQAVTFAAQARKMHAFRRRGDMTARRFEQILATLGWGTHLWMPGHTRMPLQDITGIPQGEVLEMAQGNRSVSKPLGNALEALVDGVRPWEDRNEDDAEDIEEDATGE